MGYFFTQDEIQNEVTMNDYPKLMTVQSFMVGGLVSYEDTGDGVFLLRKETLDKMMSTIEGRPVVIGHQPITLKNLEDKAVGYVTKGWFNPETGQFDCEILVKDSDVYNQIKNGNNKVSSAYQVTELGDGGKYLGQDYEAEILGGTFTHLAIVDNPRYPDAKILINSLTGEEEMGLFNKNNDVVEVASDDTIEYNGKTYLIGELVNSYLLNEEEKAKDNEDDKDNEEEKENEEEKDNEEEENEEEEKKNKKNACGKRNEDKEEENEDSDKKLEAKINKIINEILEKKENEDKEKENEDEEKNEEEKKENRNALKLRNSYLNPTPYVPEIQTRAERIKASNEKYSI